ncbi:DNA replication/repair protein RecF [bacterium]|nr:DNA replication/repair protein RecF [bacterium]
MNITHLITNNFRNIENGSVSFSDGINVLYGSNAQGKTNIIEAIYLVGTTKSFRKAEDEQFIRFSEDVSKIEARISKQGIEKDVKYLFDRTKSKKLFVNDKQVYKHADYLGSLNVTLFCPEDLMLLKGDASYRRRFMDILFCQIDKSYLFDLMNYQKILKHRNNALKEIRDNQANPSIKEPWDIQIAQYATKISQKRSKNICEINKIAEKKHFFLNKSEQLKVSYSDSICGSHEISPADYEKAFVDKQKRVHHEELRKGWTMIGPHRDDLEISINGINTRIFGSQGQKRSVAISIRMAEVDFIYQVAEEYPVLLLDDIFSELDDYRKKKLMDILDKRMQIFITGTEKTQFLPLESRARSFNILNGKAVNEGHAS